MVKPEDDAPQRELDDLLDAIYSGAIADVDELSEVELDALTQHFGDAEDIEFLFDRLRGPKPEGP